jgi:hypothetical protein
MIIDFLSPQSTKKPNLPAHSSVRHRAKPAFGRRDEGEFDTRISVPVPAVREAQPPLRAMLRTDRQSLLRQSRVTGS